MKPISPHWAKSKARPSVSLKAHISDELRRYDEHLFGVSGLATGSRKDRLYAASMLLRQNLKDRAIDILRPWPDGVCQLQHYRAPDSPIDFLKML